MSGPPEYSMQPGPPGAGPPFAFRPPMNGPPLLYPGPPGAAAIPVGRVNGVCWVSQFGGDGVHRMLVILPSGHLGIGGVLGSGMQHVCLKMVSLDAFVVVGSWHEYF